MAIPAAFVQELLARADIVEVVGRYVQLKKGGANFVGLCPFHNEKSPSFSVSPTKQFYHCFGCGKHGDAINFVMEQTGMNFVEAVRDLAQHFGLQVPEDDSSPADRARAAEQRHKQATLNDVLEKAGESYRKHLRHSERAVAYLKRRGLSGEVARDFGLGYAPEGWRGLASVFPDYDDPLLVESGLVIVSEPAEGGDSRRYDRFRDRIMFPIRNVKGECIGFGGRVLGDEKPKYLNSPETPVFSKGHELYGLYEARHAIRDAGYVLVTEGYMDVVALAQLGFPNAVATLGTACTAEHVQKLFRFTDTVVFSFDGDAAGRRAARRALDAALPYANDVRSVRFLFLPSEHDPDSFIREQGQEAFAKCVQEATPLSRFIVEAASDECDLGVAEGRARMSNQARSLWTAMPDGALRRQVLADIAQQVQLAPDDLRQLWGDRSAGAGHDPAPRRKVAARDEGNSRPGAGGWSRTSSRPTQRARAGVSRPDKLTRLLLAHSHLWDRLSATEHALLCALPDPHGAVLRWLEAHLHEHGPLPWGALNEALNEDAGGSLARQLMRDTALLPGDDVTEALAELRNLLTALHVDQLIAEESAALQALQESPSDTATQQRYRELHAQRRALQNLMTGTTAH